MKVEMVHLQVLKDNVVEYNPKKTITIPKIAANWIRPIIGTACREQILVCGMDASMKPTFIETVAVGSTSECYVSVAEVFKTALLTNSYGVMIFHNHPSGNCMPSKMDEYTTESIIKAAKLLNVKFLDHIIVGDGDNYYSFMENRAVNACTKDE